MGEGVGYLVVLLGVAASLGAVANHAREWARMVKKPHNDLSKRVDKLSAEFELFKKHTEGKHDEYERRFTCDLRRLEKANEESKIMLRGILTLITSSIDGNHVEELKERRDEIQRYLIGKA